MRASFKAIFTINYREKDSSDSHWTHLVTVLSKLAERAGAGTVASCPAARTEALACHRVTLGPAVTVTNALTVQAKEPFRTRLLTEHATPPRGAETTPTDVFAGRPILAATDTLTAGTKCTILAFYNKYTTHHDVNCCS